MGQASPLFRMRRLFIKKRTREPVVTHDTHASGASRQNGRRTPRPDLGRPSLFADFDQESVEDVEPQRIRLLSTLESQRGARKRPRGRRMPTGRAHPWLTRALMAMMGLGMLVMLLSFIQLLRRPPPVLQTPQAVAAAASSASRPAMAQAPAASQVPVEAAEIIDTAPPAGGLPAAPTPALSQATSPVDSQTSNALASASTQPPTPAATSRANTALAPVTPPEQAGRSAKTSVQRPHNKREAGASQDDVALVEAMLAHAGPRKATPPPPATALQQCGAGSSPETAVCRARICVQNPSLPACHTP